MNTERRDELDQMDATTRAAIGRKAERRLNYRRRKANTLWFGLGTMGIVGWSVAIPTVLGIALGIYLDENVPVPFSWTLTGLMLGVLLGCLNAWVWVSRNRMEIQRKREDKDET